MPQATERAVTYPIKNILESITALQQAGPMEFQLRQFAGEFFLPDSEREDFPYLADLSKHLAFPHGLGIEVAKQNMTVFEGSNEDIAIAYFGKEVPQYASITKEHGLIHVRGRRIYVRLNENGMGGIEIEDILAKEAGSKLGEDRFGSLHNTHLKGNYGFHQTPGRSSLPGVRDFLNHFIRGK